MWLADQSCHICIGIILSFIATALCGWVMARLEFATRWKYDTGIWPGLIIVAIVAAIWEWSAYNSSVKQATGKLWPGVGQVHDAAQAPASDLS
jgi:ABC-type uncharacterized transport system permease subunit